MSSDESNDPSEPSSKRASFRYRTNAILFAATVASTFLAGAGYVGAADLDAGFIGLLRALPQGWRFAVPLLTILLCHELGHYIAARLHRVPASLPYFIPAPFISPFGTMGAVIAMPDRIRSRRALLDIGAAGPIAGMVVALPVLIYGLATSQVEALQLPYQQEGQSLVYMALKRIVLGPIPAGHDVVLNATAFAGWTGLFVTALNLIPVGQLDGGHIAYALFGPKQDRIARVVHLGLLVMAVANFVRFVVPAVRAGGGIGQAISNSMFYVIWFGLLALLRHRTGMNHPPTDDSTLSPGRKVVAAGCLLLFIGLFMPVPWAQYG